MIFNLLLKYTSLQCPKRRELFDFLYLVLSLAFLFYCFDFSLPLSLKIFFNTQSEPFKHNYGINFLPKIWQVTD